MVFSNAVVSVIMPVYNGEKYIEQTLLSVLECRKFSQLEIIVVNDGSNDGTSTVLKKYEDQIVLIEQQNSGQASAINKGLNSATGKYSSIVNSDDPITNPALFMKSIKLFETDEYLAATYPDWIIIDSKGTKIKEILVSEYSETELIGKFNCLIGPGGVFKTENALNIGGWDKSFRYVPDYDFWLKLSRTGYFKRIPETLCSWRSHDDSISVKYKGKEMADERIRVMENFLFKHKISTRTKKSALAYSQYSAALLCFFDVRINGRALFWQAFHNYPLIILRTKIKSNLFLIAFPWSKKLTNLLKIQPKQ